MQDPSLPNLDDAVLQELAVEIVRDIYPLDALCQRFGITMGELDKLKRNKRFILMLGEAAIAWDSSTATRERLRIKGDVIVEQMMVRAFQYYCDDKQPLAARAKLMETVAKISGAYAEGNRPPTTIAGADVGKPSDKVQININLHPTRQGGATVVIDQQQLVLPAHDPIDVTTGS